MLRSLTVLLLLAARHRRRRPGGSRAGLPAAEAQHRLPRRRLDPAGMDGRRPLPRHQPPPVSGQAARRVLHELAAAGRGRGLRLRQRRQHEPPEGTTTPPPLLRDNYISRDVRLDLAWVRPQPREVPQRAGRPLRDACPLHGDDLGPRPARAGRGRHPQLRIAGRRRGWPSPASTRAAATSCPRKARSSSTPATSSGWDRPPPPSRPEPRTASS